MNEEEQNKSVHWSIVYRQLGNLLEQYEVEIARLKSQLVLEKKLRIQVEKELESVKTKQISSSASSKVSSNTIQELDSTTDEDEIPGSDTVDEEDPSLNAHFSEKNQSVKILPHSPTLPVQNASAFVKPISVPLGNVKEEKFLDTNPIGAESFESSDGEMHLRARSPEDMILLRETQPLAPLDINTLGVSDNRQKKGTEKKRPFEPEFLNDDVVRGNKRKALPAYECPDCQKFYELHGPVKESSVAPSWNDENRLGGGSLPNCKHQPLVQKVGRHRKLNIPKPIPNGFWESDFVD